MRAKSINCRWTWATRPNHETVFLSNGMHMMEKEVTAEEIVFEGDQLVYGRIYTIRIRDAQVKIPLEGRFFGGRLHTLKASIQNSPKVFTSNIKSNQMYWLTKRHR